MLWVSGVLGGGVRRGGNEVFCRRISHTGLSRRDVSTGMSMHSKNKRLSCVLLGQQLLNLLLEVELNGVSAQDALPVQEK